MSFQIDWICLRGWWVGIISLSFLLMSLTGCGARLKVDPHAVSNHFYSKTFPPPPYYYPIDARRENSIRQPEPTKAELEEMMQNLPVRKNWQHRTEQFLELAGIKPVRFEWAPATRGSYFGFKKFQILKPPFSPYTHITGWYGCGWAHYRLKPQGVGFNPLPIAISLDKNDEITYAYLGWEARTKCRFAPGPTHPDGREIEVISLEWKPSSTRATKALTTDLGWVRSVSHRDELFVIEVQEGLTDEQIREVFFLLNGQPSKAKLKLTKTSKSW